MIPYGSDNAAMSTGYQITFSDFRQLLSHPEYRRDVGPLVQSWFTCRVVPTEDGFALLDASGVEMSPRAVHEAIQADPDRQQRIYQEAMSLWR
jgi:hypothetical protein